MIFKPSRTPQREPATMSPVRNAQVYEARLSVEGVYRQLIDSEIVHLCNVRTRVFFHLLGKDCPEAIGGR